MDVIELLALEEHLEKLKKQYRLHGWLIFWLQAVLKESHNQDSARFRRAMRHLSLVHERLNR